MCEVDPVLTGEAARLIGCSTRTIVALERAGRLPAVRTGDGVRIFDRPDVLRVASERRAAKADRAVA